MKTRKLTDSEVLVVDNFIVGHFQISRCRSLPDTTRSVVMGSVARAVVPAKITGIGDWHATEVSANSDDDQPIRMLNANIVGFRVAEFGDVHRLFTFDLLWRPVSACEEKYLNWNLLNQTTLFNLLRL